MEIGFFVALKYELLQSKTLAAWMRKGCYGSSGRVPFELGLQFLCDAQLFAELGKPR